MTFRLIGIAGKAGAGKDTAADYLVERYGFTKWALAAPIKAGLQTMLGLDQRVYDRRDKKEQPIEPFGKSYRQMCQTLGTEWGRQLVHPEVWLMRAEQVINNAIIHEVPGVVVSDLRFQDEVAWLRKCGGKAIYISRPGVAPVSAHSSENDIGPMDCDAAAVNNGTVHELFAVMDLFVGRNEEAED